MSGPRSGQQLVERIVASRVAWVIDVAAKLRVADRRADEGPRAAEELAAAAGVAPRPPLLPPNHNLTGSASFWKSRPDLSVPDLMFVPMQVHPPLARNPRTIPDPTERLLDGTGETRVDGLAGISSSHRTQETSPMATRSSATTAQEVVP